MKNRKDNWKEEDDQLLTSIVLDYISTGRTQLQAFEDAGNQLSRTAAACGFRWNSELRHINKEQILEAKRKRSQKKNNQALVVTTTNKNAEYNIISSLQDLEKALQLAVKSIQSISTNVSIEFNNYEEKINAIKSSEGPGSLFSDDMHALMELLSKAKRLGLYDKIG